VLEAGQEVTGYFSIHRELKVLVVVAGLAHRGCSFDRIAKALVAQEKLKVVVGEVRRVLGPDWLENGQLRNSVASALAKVGQASLRKARVVNATAAALAVVATFERLHSAAFATLWKQIL